MRPHRWQPTRLRHSWDSPGKNTGVGCHFLLQCMKVKSESEVTQSCPTLRDPMDCSLPSSSVHGIFQARVPVWGANYLLQLLLYWLHKPLTEWITINWKILKQMGILDYFTCFLRNLHAGQEATVRTGHGTTDWFQIGKGVQPWCHPAYLTYMQST